MLKIHIIQGIAGPLQEKGPASWHGFEVLLQRKHLKDSAFKSYLRRREWLVSWTCWKN
jgi:hypothetical protein